MFIVPARAETLLNYSIHGKDKDLLHLKDDSNGITRVLHYKKGVKVPPKNNSYSIITHHVRIIGQHNTRHPRHTHIQMEGQCTPHRKSKEGEKGFPGGEAILRGRER